MKKNICLIVNTLREGGGIERAVLSLAQSLSKSSYRVDVIVLDKQSNSFSLDDFNFNLHYIQQTKLPTKFIQSIKQANLLKKKITEIGVRFDLFIANSTYDALVCKRANLPNTYYIIHNSLNTQHNQETSAIEFRKQVKGYSIRGICTIIIKKLLYKSFIASLYSHENLIAVSQGVKQDLLNFGILPKTLRVIHNPFDFSYIRGLSKSYKVNEENYIVHVGNFTTVKRYDVLINAYHQSGIKQKLLLLGDHTRESGVVVKQLISDLNLNNRVVLKGFQPNPFPYIKNAQALILSSDQEGFGMVLVEALILKTPVVSTNCISGPNEILIDELQQFLSPIGDSKALARNLKNAIDNPIKITHKYINRFSGAKVAEQYLSL